MKPMRTMFCDEDPAHHGDRDETGFRFPEEVAEPQACLDDECSGKLWLNRECIHMDRGSYYAPPEECGKPTNPGNLYCARHGAEGDR